MSGKRWLYFPQRARAIESVVSTAYQVLGTSAIPFEED